MPDSITAFVEARLAEDQDVAEWASRRATAWGYDESQSAGWNQSPRDPQVIAGGKPILTEDTEYSRGFAVEHAARQDPQATLDRVGPLRRIVQLHRPEPLDEDRDACTECGAGTARIVVWPCPTVRALASIWRRHDDWQKEWET